MKVLIVGFFSKTYMPYMQRYENILNEKNIQYDIATFDRDSVGKNIKEGNTYLFRHTTSTNKLEVFWLSIKYRKMLNKIIKKNKYDKIIVMTTIPAILLYKKLIKQYKSNYIFDYRDYTYEKNLIYRKVVDKIIKYSYSTLMSSKGYMKYFKNKDKIIITHNISNENDKEMKAEKLNTKNHINIGFLGYVRYFDVNTKLINAFKNSSKYNMTYIGVPFSDCDLNGYCNQNKIKNVKFIGKYENSDKCKYYKEIDIINSIYSLNSQEVKPAIPNRLYDAALFKKPIVTAKGTYLSEIVEKYKLGFTIDVFNNNIEEKFEEYIKKFDAKEFEKNCNIFLSEVYKDENNCNYKVKEFLMK